MACPLVRGGGHGQQQQAILRQLAGVLHGQCTVQRIGRLFRLIGGQVHEPGLQQRDPLQLIRQGVQPAEELLLEQAARLFTAAAQQHHLEQPDRDSDVVPGALEPVAQHLLGRLQVIQRQPLHGHGLGRGRAVRLQVVGPVRVTPAGLELTAATRQRRGRGQQRDAVGAHGQQRLQHLQRLGRLAALCEVGRVIDGQQLVVRIEPHRAIEDQRLLRPSALVAEQAGQPQVGRDVGVVQ